MTTSVSAMSLYALLPLLALLIPYASFLLGKGNQQPGPLLSPLACALMLAGAVVLTMFSVSSVPVFAALLLLPLIGGGIGSMLGGVTAILLFSTALWWERVPQNSAVPAVIFIALGTACAFLPRWRAPNNAEIRLIGPMLISVLIGVLAGLPTAPFESTDQIFTAWHHWSAYMAPVEAWRGGGLPYRDFPIQYGLGPTALIMASCGNDCWAGLYKATVAANALYFATLTGCVLILTAKSSRGVRWLALIALFCASFLWTGFAPYFAGPAMTPGVAGIRFLSLSALLLYILWSEHRQIRRDWIGHAIWFTALFWSPEAGAFATLIWWPYLALRDAETATDARSAIMALIRGALRGALALAAGVGALVLTLWHLSGGGITTADFFAYVQHPPGMLPIDPAGAVWIALVPILLAARLVAQRGLSPSARPVYACLITLLAAGTYFISRSHDNNILNLFPLTIPLLLAILTATTGKDDTAPDFVRALMHTTLAGMIAFIALFNFEPWLAGIRQVGPLATGPARLLTSFTGHQGRASTILSPDAIAGLAYLRQHNSGAVVLLDERKVIVRQPGDASWTAVNNVANFWPLPDAMIIQYIQRGARTYHRPGWLLAQDKYAAWVNAFKTAYDVRAQKRFGTYTAYYMVPRS